MASQASASSQQQSSAPEEFVIRVPVSTEKKKYSVLKFSSNLGIDVKQWDQIGLAREDNARIVVGDTQTDPKFGAGSEYGKQAREEARRKKLGFRSRRYRIDDQPWLMTLPGKQDRKFRGQKEGGVTEHADYWIFVKSGEGAFDAYPVSNWYNFMPVSRYKTLDAEEAEEQFQQRHKVINQWALKSMFKAGNAEEDSKEGVKGAAGKKKKGDDEDDEIGAVGPTKGVPKGQGKKKPAKKRKANFDDDDPMASADSDDGDEEGRELDYISSTDTDTDDELPEETRNDRGVDEEAGMRQLIASEDEEELEQGEKEDEDQKPDLTKLETVTTTGFEDGEERESDSGSDSDDPDKEDIKSALFIMQKQKTEASPTPPAAGASAASTSAPESSKRKLATGTDATDQPAPKKHKSDRESKPKSEKPATMEEEVRRYLQRRPLSTTDLVSKFKKRCEGMPKQEIVQKLADILKRLKPEQERRNGVLYFSLKKD